MEINEHDCAPVKLYKKQASYSFLTAFLGSAWRNRVDLNLWVASSRNSCVGARQGQKNLAGNRR